MSALERLASAGTNSVGQYTFIDADTLRDPKDPNISYRLQGFDAPEISKFNAEGKQYDAGTAGASTATSTISALAQTQGFTNLVKTGKMDPNGREIVELHDKNGRNFTTELLKSGALEPGKYTTQEDIDAIDVAKAFGNQSKDASEFGKASDIISGAIQNESTRDMEFKTQAVNENYLSKDVPPELRDRFTTAVDFRRGDRTINNVSLNPLSDSWEQGWIGAKEGAFGFLELLGDTAGLEKVQDIGEQGIARARHQQAEYAEVLTDWKDVEGFKSGVSFLANNAAMSLPYMVTTGAAVAAGALAAPVVGAAGAFAISIGAPATIYAGQTWNEMTGEKNAGLALSAGLVQAALDRLGIGAIAGKVVPDKVLNQAVQKIMQQTGVTKAAAEATLAGATKRELAGYLGDVAKVAGQQITAKAVTMDLIKRGAIGSFGEAGTEAAQELTAYTAAKAGSDGGLAANFNWNEAKDRLIGAAIAGGSLGGVFSTPGSLKNNLAWADVAYRTQGADAANESTSGVYAAQEKAELGYVPSITENIARTQSEIATSGVGSSLDERADAFRATQAKRTTNDKLTEALLNVSSLWQGATRNIFTPGLQEQSRSARVLADMFGGNLQRIFSGSNFESAKHHRVAIYKNMVVEPRAFFGVFGQGKRQTNKFKEEVSKKTYDALRAAQDTDGNFNPDLIPEGPNKAAVVLLGNQLNALADKMHADQKAHNSDLGYVKNYLFKYKAFNKKAIHKNRARFQAALQRKHGYNAAEARELVEAIVNNEQVSDLNDAFSVTKGGIVPASHRERSLNLSEDKDFAEFMENDLFSNVSQAAKSAARYTAHREYIGQNGEVIGKLLENMQKEGVPEAEVNRVAARMKDYLDAESGNYKRPTSELGKKAQSIQKNAMTLMTLSGLPLATISSFVELMLVNRGLNNEQIFGKEGSLKSTGIELGKTLRAGVEEIGGSAIRREIGEGPVSPARTKLRELGYYEWDVGAATVTGVTETNTWQKGLYENFFKATGLTGWTNYTRAVRASMAGDYIVDKSEIIWAERQGAERTAEVQEAEESLRNLGIDVDRFAELQTKVTGGLKIAPEEQAFLDNTMREATFNFINEAVVLPGSANRPLIYQDPRFALFTQFQGFIATFTANHIPKLWGEYVKRGTPAMKYNAFATMTTMIMMSFAAQHIKDWIKYGPGDEEEVTGKNPYLDTAQYVRRGVQASGLLGTGERVLNFAFPIYESRSDSPGDWLYNSTVGESPGLGYVQRVGGAAGAIAQGDVGKAAKNTVKAFPLIGPFSFAADWAGDKASSWNFNGE